MNKLSIGLLLAASFIFLDASPAAAHQRADRVRAHDYGHQFEARRYHDMPRWLKRNDRFRHWYRHSPLKRHRQISWNQLFEIYRWERRYFRTRYRIAYDRHQYRQDGDRWRYRDD